MTHFIKIFIVICHGPYGPNLTFVFPIGTYILWPIFPMVILVTWFHGSMWLDAMMIFDRANSTNTSGIISKGHSNFDYQRLNFSLRILNFLNLTKNDGLFTWRCLKWIYIQEISLFNLRDCSWRFSSLLKCFRNSQNASSRNDDIFINFPYFSTLIRFLANYQKVCF